MRVARVVYSRHTSFYRSNRNLTPPLSIRGIPNDSSGVQLRLTVKPESGPHIEVLTYDFPVVQPAATTLRLRWGTVVVPLEIAVQGPEKRAVVPQ